MGALKDYRAPCHSGILEQSNSCTLSWGEPGEALRVPCTQSGKGADEMAAWILWAARHSRVPLGQHQEPTHLSSKEGGGPDRKGKCAQDPSTEPQRPFPLVTEDQLEQHFNGSQTVNSTKNQSPMPNAQRPTHPQGDIILEFRQNPRTRCFHLGFFLFFGRGVE